MEGHPIPRQITTFEFKLIGFLTLHQFIYLVIFFPIGFVVYKLFPIPYLNILVGLLVAAIGPVVAFVPINDRPMDVWLRNFMKRLTSPTQYVFHKENKPLPFFGNLYFTQDPHRVMAHIESQEKLAAYVAQKKKANPQLQSKKQAINVLFHTQQTKTPPPTTTQPVLQQPISLSTPSQTQTPPQQHTTQTVVVEKPQESIPSSQPHPTNQPFFTGVVKNHKLIPLPGILIYVKNEKGETVRLLKSNPHGVFATFSPLPPGQYTFELKDPREGYFFDTMNLPIDQSNLKPIEFFSKELL